MIEHLLGGLVDGATPGCDVLVGFPLPASHSGVKNHAWSVGMDT